MGPAAGTGLRALAPAVVAVATLVAFLPALDNRFLTWDDIDKFQTNLHYRGLGAPQLRWMWTTTFTGLYQPVAWMTWGVDYLLWGMAPAGYHLTSLVLHTATAVAVYVLALRLLAWRGAGTAVPDGTADRLGAGLAALFFALHPLRAEPVAWVSARGDLLAGLFAVLSVLAYLRAAGAGDGRRAHGGWLASAVGLFGVSLLSKPTAATLPAALLVLDVYPLRRLGAGRWWGADARRLWLEKLPFAAAALAVVPLALLGKAETTTMLPRETFDAATGVAKAVFSAAFYLRKTFILGTLSPVYERPPRIDPAAWPFVGSAVAVAAVTSLLILGRRRWPAGLAAWAAYLALLAPTAGLVPYGSQIVSARYTYLAGVPLALLVGAAGARGARQSGRGRPRPALAAAWVLVGVGAVGLGVLTWRQVQVWHDSRTLWTYTLALNPRSALAHMELGLLDDRDGDRAAAAEHFGRALALWPDYGRAHLALGRVLAHDGALDRAAAQLAEGLRLLPGSAEGHVVLGDVLARQGRGAEAIREYRTALALRPDVATVHYRMAVRLAEQGMPGEAAAHYRRALELNPRLDEARAGLARALDALGTRSRSAPPAVGARP